MKSRQTYKAELEARSNLKHYDPETGLEESSDFMSGWRSIGKWHPVFIKTIGPDGKTKFDVIEECKNPADPNMWRLNVDWMLNDQAHHGTFEKVENKEHYWPIAGNWKENYYFVNFEANVALRIENEYHRRFPHSIGNLEIFATELMARGPKQDSWAGMFMDKVAEFDYLKYTEDMFARQRAKRALEKQELEKKKNEIL
jgi:hypothetical protein